MIRMSLACPVAIRVHTAFNPAAQAGGLTSRLFLYAPK